MGLPITISEIAPRISAGAFILNSGLGKRGADEAAAAGMHGFAAGTYPFLKSVPPQQFAKALSTSEIALGGLLGLYLKTPGMRKPGSLAPTEAGLAIAKDSWLLGIGIGLLTRGTVDRKTRPARRRR